MTRARRLLLIGATVAVLGEGGHLVLEWIGWRDHHLFHVVYPLVAAALFLDYAIRDIRRNGWPRVGWRLPPRDPRRTAA